MTPNQIERAGRILFGSNWKTEFADHFLIDKRFLRRLLAGSIMIPDGLLLEIETAPREHGQKLDDLMLEITQ